MKKYELTNRTINYKGRTLYRIKALRDFGNVEKDVGVVLLKKNPI